MTIAGQTFNVTQAAGTGGGGGSSLRASYVGQSGDFDGDGRDDLAVWRGQAGAWFVIQSATNNVIAPGWGSEQLGDVPVTPMLIKR